MNAVQAHQVGLALKCPKQACGCRNSIKYIPTRQDAVEEGKLRSNMYAFVVHA